MGVKSSHTIPSKLTKKGYRRKEKPAGISLKVIYLLEIYTMIAHKKYPTVTFLSERFKVSPRTIYRYLEIINMIDAIELDQERKGYVFTTGDRIKKIGLTDSEFLVLLAAGDAVSHLGHPFRDEFQRVVEKMVFRERKPGTQKESPVIVKIPDAVESERIAEYVQILSRCVDEKRSVDILYKASHSKEALLRTVDPYGLVFYDGIWMLVGFCNLRKQIRSFVLDRIRDLKERWRYFEQKKDFDLKSFLSRSWGIHDGPDVTVTVRIKPEIADYVLRKRWHPSEVRTMLPNGEAELTFTVAGVVEIKRWIYSWFPSIEVVKPQWLRKQVVEELRQSLEYHT